MDSTSKIYVVGAGSIGMPLAALLSAQGAAVTAVRTSLAGIKPTNVEVTIELAEGRSVSTTLEMVSLSEVKKADDGIIALTTKATSNTAIAAELKEKFPNLPLVVMQNGLGVEQPFITEGFSTVFRCVLYATGQTIRKDVYRFREVSESPIGIVQGSTEKLHPLISHLSTPEFRFIHEENIEKQAWKKAIINAAFNSICPLLSIDNGIFHRDESVEAIAKTIIEEASSIAARLGIHFEKHALIDQLLLISRRSDGQLISTLQDINNGKETEIGFLNMEIARVGAALSPPVNAPITQVLGEMILAKSRHNS